MPDHYRRHPTLQKLFQANGNYVRPAEDPVTLWAIDILVREYNVPLEAMQLELYADFSEGTYQGGRRYQGRADVVIYDDRYSHKSASLIWSPLSRHPRPKWCPWGQVDEVE